MLPETCKEKRDFTRTAEPEGWQTPGGRKSFVVQKHDARRLHFDPRLEMDGVLNSRAIIKGANLDPSQNCLAVQVDDRPLGHGGFKGTIHKGSYGAGMVIL